MKKGEIFWGILLLTLGVLFLFRNLDIFNFSIGSLLRLWPLIFVFWGISLLPVKQGIKLLLVGITILLGILILSFAPHHDNQWFEWKTDEFYNDWNDEDEAYERDEEETSKPQDFSELYDSVVTTAKLNLDAAAGKFYIKNPTAKLFELNNEGDADPYIINTTLNDSAAIIYVKHKNKVHSRDLKNSAWLALNPGPVWNLDINVGAAELDMDVTPYKIEQIDIDGGASKIDLKLGSGCKYTHVNIDAGASGITIRVPYESACELHTNTVLSARDIVGFNKISGGLYQTPNFTDSINQIIIEIDAAVSSLEVKRVQPVL
jgi:hypothetical protein